MSRRLAALLGLLLVATSAACSAESPPDERHGGGSSTSPTSSPASASSTGRSGAGPAAGRSTYDPHTPASGPTELARRLGAAEDAVRDPATPAAELADAGFALQVLYRQLGRHPGWDARVLRSMPARYRATVRAHLTARRELRSMHRTLSPTLPAWRIVDPAPAGELRRFYREGERVFGVPWEILAAINLVETAMGRIRGTSTAGAQGPMQFIPETWARYGRGDINDPRDAILAAARYLAANGGGRGAIDTALYRYNNHPAYVAAVKAYASVMAADPRAFRGLYHWQVIYLSRIGDVWLPVGYVRRTPIAATTYVVRHPDRRLSTSTR